MPTTRRRRSRDWNPDLGAFHRQALLEGPAAVLIACAGYHRASCATLPDLPEAEWLAGLAEMRRDWAIHGRELTAEFRAENGREARPWGWWQFDATDAQCAGAGFVRRTGGNADRAAMPPR